MQFASRQSAPLPHPSKLYVGSIGEDDQDEPEIGQQHVARLHTQNGTTSFDNPHRARAPVQAGVKRPRAERSVAELRLNPLDIGRMVWKATSLVSVPAPRQTRRRHQGSLNSASSMTYTMAARSSGP